MKRKWLLLAVMVFEFMPSLVKSQIHPAILTPAQMKEAGMDLIRIDSILGNDKHYYNVFYSFDSAGVFTDATVADITPRKSSKSSTWTAFSIKCEWAKENEAGGDLTCEKSGISYPYYKNYSVKLSEDRSFALVSHLNEPFSGVAPEYRDIPEPFFSHSLVGIIDESFSKLIQFDTVPDYFEGEVTSFIASWPNIRTITILQNFETYYLWYEPSSENDIFFSKQDSMFYGFSTDKEGKIFRPLEDVDFVPIPKRNFWFATIPPGQYADYKPFMEAMKPYLVFNSHPENTPFYFVIQCGIDEYLFFKLVNE